MVIHVDQNYARRSRPPLDKPRQADRHNFFEDEPDDIYPTRMPSSTRRYQSDVRMEVGRAQADVQPYGRTLSHTRKSSIPARRTAIAADSGQLQPARRRAVDTEDIPFSPARRWPRWPLFAGIGLLLMLVSWFVLSGLISWWQVTQDDWHYGRPRTSQMDYAVGHGDSTTHPSHFIAINLRQHVEIFEIPGNDPAKTRIYAGPVLIGPNQDLAVVTLTFKDVNNDGKTDMIVNVQDSHYVFINDVINGIPQFRPLRPGENIQL